MHPAVCFRHWSRESFSLPLPPRPLQQSPLAGAGADPAAAAASNTGDGGAGAGMPGEEEQEAAGQQVCLAPGQPRRGLRAWQHMWPTSRACGLAAAVCLPQASRQPPARRMIRAQILQRVARFAQDDGSFMRQVEALGEAEGLRVMRRALAARQLTPGELRQQGQAPAGSAVAGEAIHFLCR